MPGGYESKWPQSNVRPDLQPRYDSYGRKVPEWAVNEVEGGVEQESPRRPSTWRSWLRKDSAFTSTSSRTYSSDSQFQTEDDRPPWWKPWVSRSGPGANPRLNAKDEPSSPYSPVSSRVFGDSQQYWKPVTVKLPVLGSIFLITIALIAGLEVLYHRSTGKNGGGLAFAATIDELPTLDMASYLYLPTTLAVVYAMVWAWVDLDVKRLEPWFQLSQSQGAVAEDSLLLSYPFDFLAFVPFAAARRRHWAVFLAGFTIVFITWGIVPLQSAIFSTGTVLRTRTSPSRNPDVLLPVSNQSYALTSQLFKTAYGISWLEQRTPEFTTRGYALTPFRASILSVDGLESETWTSETQMYYTNLTCKPPRFYRGPTATATHANGIPILPWLFEDDEGCIAGVASPASPYGNRTQLFGYKLASTPVSTVDGNLANCTGPRNMHKFLALASNTTATDGSEEFGAPISFFCEPAYYVRTVNATVNASNLAVVDVSYDITAVPSAITEDVFNISTFESMLDYGANKWPSRNNQLTNGSDYMEVEQYPRVVDFNVTWPAGSDPMVGFALAAYANERSSVSSDALMDPVQLQGAIDAAHKLLFATAINQLFVSKPDAEIAGTADSDSQPLVVIKDSPAAITYVRPFAIVVEVCLGVVAGLTGALWAYYRRRATSMVSDPGTIFDVMKLVRSSDALLQDFADDDGKTKDEDLQKRLKGHSFRLIATTVHGRPTMQLQAAAGYGRVHSIPLQSRRTIDGPEQFYRVRPFQLQFTAGFMIMALITGAAAAVITLYIKIDAEDGIRKPTRNELAMAILTNLVPTAFAMMIEPIWIVLNRLLCVLQPFKDLQNGGAKAGSSIQARYTSIPPQLAFWRALRFRHFLLVAVCAVAMSTNVLAVALGALFEEKPTTVLVPSVTKPKYTPVLKGSPDFMENSVDGTRIDMVDHFYAALANLSGAAPLPPWVDNEYWFMPFDLPKNDSSFNLPASSMVSGYSATTRGFGVDIDCQEINDQGNGDKLVFEPNKMGAANISEEMREWEFSLSHVMPDGQNITCGQWNFASNNATYLNFENGWGPGPSAFEVSGVGGLNNDTSTFNVQGRIGVLRMPPPDNGYCALSLILGWARLSGILNNATESYNRRTMEKSFMRCEPRLKSAMFNTLVDTNGRILSSNRTTEFDTDNELFGGDLAVRGLLEQINQLASGKNRWRWRSLHNQTVANDWFNEALAMSTGSMRLVDPLKPVPVIKDTIPSVQETYRLIAALLLSYNAKSFIEARENDILLISIVTTEERIFMDPIMFYVCVILLAIQLVTLVFYYVFRPRPFLPRMPLTIASIITYVSASQATQDVDFIAEDKKARFGYGRFRGVDGKSHVGIEIEPLVVPLKSGNPQAKRRAKGTWFKKEVDERVPSTWI